jgi:hypothetical protein
MPTCSPDWAKPHEQWFIDGYLRGDRERMVLGLLPESGCEKTCSTFTGTRSLRVSPASTTS